MDIQYIKEQFIPKSRKLKIIYGILWVLEPMFMGIAMGILITYKLSKLEKEQKNNVQ